MTSQGVRPMKQFLRSGFLLIAACAASGLGLHAQTVLYSTDFPDDQGWTLGGNSFAWWAVDDTPATVGWHSAPYSLNFNNGTCFCSPLAIGAATSPAIDLSAGIGSLALGFWCIYIT